MRSKTLPIEMAPTVAFASLTPTRKVIVCGPHASGLASYTASRAVFERLPIRIICSDNRFDPYAVARLAKVQGFSPEAVLRTILIARAFTAYQLVELVERLDTQNRLVLITGPCSTLFDEDVAFVDAARLFYRMLWRLVELAREGLTLMLVQRELPQNPRRAYFLKDLCYAGDVVLNCDGLHSFRLEHRGRVALPRLAALNHQLRN